MQVTLKIFRYNPEDNRKKHYDTFTVEAEPTDRILDLLERIKGTEDGTLGFRRACAHGVCGSDAIRINGVNRLACKVLVQDLKSKKVTIEPILGLPIEKDLIVDITGQLCLTLLMMILLRVESACKVLKSGNALTIRPNASCARPALPAVRPSGSMKSMSDRQPLSMPTDLFLTAGIRRLRNG